MHVIVAAVQRTKGAFGPMRFLFLAAGPGFNGFAERVILKPVIESAGHHLDVWDEPSRLRPGGDPFDPVGAFGHWLDSAERKLTAVSASESVVLMAHSFSIHAAIHLARRHASRLAGLVLIAPAVDAFATFTNVLGVAARDLEEDQPDIAAALGACLTRTRTIMDDAMREGMALVLHDAKIMTHYWADPGQLQASLAAQNHPEARFDVDSFFSVLGDYAARGSAWRSEARVETPTLVLFGRHDPITPRDAQAGAVQSEIPHAVIDTLEDGGHYLHLDRPGPFMLAVTGWLALAGQA
jgi:pimeloyl-ACP methyl ester carboxylesterase